MPCQRVSTTGRYLFGSVLNRMVAPAARLRLTLLSSSIFPVIQVPAGTVTRPPLAAAQAAIALAEAAVLSGPPDRAPKLVIGKSRAGKVGGTIRPRMAGTWSHGSAGGAAAGPAAGPRPAAGPTMAASAAVPVAPASSAPPAVRPPILSRSRRLGWVTIVFLLVCKRLHPAACRRCVRLPGGFSAGPPYSRRIPRTTRAP